MAQARTRTRRAFRPAVDGHLESRFLLSSGGHSHTHLAPPIPRHPVNRAPAITHIQTANGGRAVVISDASGARYEVTLTSTLQTAGTPAVTAGIVTARPLPGGKVALTVYGTNENSDLAISPVLKTPQRGFPHDVATGFAGTSQMLNIGSINVVSGQIGLIEGYHTAVLSGPITALGTTPVSRIAFADLLPGAAIAVGGDLETLDVLNSVNLSGGGSIVVGRDLDWFDGDGNVTLTGGSSIIVGRNIGTFAQPAKGTGPGGQGGFFAGNLVIGPGSFFRVGNQVSPNTSVTFFGTGTGVSNIVVGQPIGGGPFIFEGGFIP